MYGYKEHGYKENTVISNPFTRHYALCTNEYGYKDNFFWRITFNGNLVLTDNFFSETEAFLISVFDCIIE
jgi:hypothetical protein